MTKDPTYWRSLGALYGTGPIDELKAHEFMAGVTDDFNPAELSTVSRKQFLALLAASAAFAAAGCTAYRDKGEIVPYTRKPEEVTPGVPNYYASTCTACPQACGILVKAREGRPIKIDGNPEHPVNKGKTCARGQASILNMYDPYRLREPLHGSASGKTGAIDWLQVDAEVPRQLREIVKAGHEIALVVPTLTSPTTNRVLRDFAATYPGTNIYTLSSLNELNRTSAWERCYGTRNLPRIKWDEAKVIVALESDFLGTEGGVVEQIRLFADGRDVVAGKQISRLYCIEGQVSQTGANADYRLRIRGDAHLDVVLALINELCAVRGAIETPAYARDIVRLVTLQTVADTQGLNKATLSRLVDDLLAFRGKALVHAGSGLPEEVHIAVNLLNDLLGNGALLDHAAFQVTHGPVTSSSQIAALVGRMKAGAVGGVIHVGVNPAYHLPPALGFDGALHKVPLSISLTEAEDETSRLCTYMLPVHTNLESWGDHNIRNGVMSLQQPLINPLYATRQKEAILLQWTQPDKLFDEKAYHNYLRTRWETEVFPSMNASTDFTTFWFSALHDGVVLADTRAVSPPAFGAGALAQVQPHPANDGFVLLVTSHAALGDGMHANNGWLQELPHPITKVVWDNYAALSPTTAKSLAVQDGDLVEIKSAEGTQTLPVFVQAGQADKTVSVALGYGRWNAGPVGSNVGAHIAMLLPSTRFAEDKIVHGISVRRVEGRSPLVTTQEHHALDEAFVKDFAEKREIIQEGTVGEYEENPEFLHKKKHELFSIATEVEYKGVKWAMAIDLNRCVGCNACVSGCNVENNLPVVGKDQVDRGREMQWIRIDRYYRGEPDDPTLSHQPMLCQHCDQAPCENVCPVVATTHSPDGLNQMTYNRCVGTKYCSNNCPYKVRRFNFYNFRDNFADGYYLQTPLELMHNPDVTVRSRGVMEKCTFCVQRIMDARQHAAEQGRPVAGSDVRTACQEACPASAITFGDMNDPQSEVSKLRNHPLGYHVLEDVNTRPNVTYIARLRNIKGDKPA
jgi:MoCo/4Fe-4S cofactor protein with predicted Tat translocation signal